MNMKKIFLLVLSLQSFGLLQAMGDEGSYINQITIPIESIGYTDWNVYSIAPTQLAVELNQNSNDLTIFTVYNLQTKASIFTKDFYGNVRNGKDYYLLSNNAYDVDNNTLSAELSPEEYILAIDSEGKYLASVQFRAGKQNILIYEKTDGMFRSLVKTISDIKNYFVSKTYTLNPSVKNNVVGFDYKGGYKAISFEDINNLINLEEGIPQVIMMPRSMQSSNMFYDDIRCFSQEWPVPGKATGYAFYDLQEKKWHQVHGFNGTWDFFGSSNYVLTSVYTNSEKKENLTFQVVDMLLGEPVEIEGFEEINEIAQRADFDILNMDIENKNNFCILSGPQKMIVRIYYNKALLYFVVDLVDRKVFPLQCEESYTPDERDDFIVDSLQLYQEYYGDLFSFLAYKNKAKNNFMYSTLSMRIPFSIHNFHEAEQMLQVHEGNYPHNNKVQYYVNNGQKEYIFEPDSSIGEYIPLGYLERIKNCHEFAYFEPVAIFVEESSGQYKYLISFYDAPHIEPVKQIECDKYRFTTDNFSNIFTYLVTKKLDQNKIDVFYCGKNSSEEQNSNDGQQGGQDADTGRRCLIQ